MSDRETLEAALAAQDQFMTWLTANGWNLDNGRLKSVWDAARERLAQLPEKCGTCEGSGQTRYLPEGSKANWKLETCPACHGSGKVYPQEAVDFAFEVIQSLTNPRYVVYSEWQQGGAAIHEQDADALGETE